MMAIMVTREIVWTGEMCITCKRKTRHKRWAKLIIAVKKKKSLYDCTGFANVVLRHANDTRIVWTNTKRFNAKTSKENER